MATCSNGHSNIEDQVYCRECAASLVALNRGLLAHNPTEGMHQEPGHSLPGRTSARRLPSTAVGPLVAVIAAMICIAVTFAIAESRAPIRGHLSSGRPAAPSARPDESSSSDRATGLATWAAPRGTDLQGFLGYPGARCNSANPAVAIGRTPKSLMVICENYDGGFYYKGLGLGDGHSVEVDNFVRAEDEFTASNSGVQCRVSPAALIVTRGKATIINEPMLEYWSV
jgi:hypothetical protein